MITSRPRNLSEETAVKGLAAVSMAPSASPVAQESVSVAVLNEIAGQLQKLQSLSQTSEESSSEDTFANLRNVLTQMAGSLAKGDMQATRQVESSTRIDKATLEGLKKAAEEMLVKVEENASNKSSKKKAAIFGSVAGIVLTSTAPYLLPAAAVNIVLGSGHSSVSEIKARLNDVLEKSSLTNEEKAEIYAQITASLSAMSSTVGLTSSASTVASAPVAEENDDLYVDLRNSLYSMVGTLEMNKVDVAKTHAARAEMSLAMDKILTASLLNKHEDLLDVVAENAAAREKEKTTSKIARIFGAIFAAITIALTAVFSPATAVIMAVLLIASTVPVGSNGESMLELAAGGIAQGLQNAGMSEEAAEFLANLIVVVAVTLATKGACKGSNKMLNKEVGIGPMTKSQNKFHIKEGAMTEFALVNSLGSLGLTSSFIMALPIENEEAQEIAAQVFGFVEQLVASLWSFKTLGSVGGFGKGSTVLDSKIIQNISLWAQKMNVIAGIGMGVTATVQGSYLIKMGNYAAEMGEIEAEIIKLSQAINMNAMGQKQQEKQQDEMIEAQQAITESYSKLSAGVRALSEALA